tara:strand:+ start:193 stop:339 length:147 start_codon:yes stop_codon:yes gene_type:complete
MTESWTDKNGDVYVLDAKAPEGVIRYVKEKKSKAKKSVKKNASSKKGN